MVFENLNKTELRKVAEEFGVDLEEGAKKQEIISALERDGVTWELYKKAFPDKDETEVEPTEPEITQTRHEPEPVKATKASDQVLMKMVRGNPTFEIRGHRFTRKHPFALVSSEDANYIIEHLSGFRIASPREAEEFYS